MLRDLRFAVHLLVKDRWYTAVAVVALALGIGVNATVFTLVNAVLIRGLPFKDSASLYMLGTVRQGGSATAGGGGVSYADFEDWRAESRSFTGLAAFASNGVTVADDKAAPQQARGAAVTPNTFTIIDQQPLFGRTFAPGDDRKGAEPVVILGYTLWKTRYASDTNILGHVARIDGRPTTIIGVMPDGMMFPSNTELWTPLIPTDEQESRAARFLGVFGRLRAGLSRREAQTEMNGIGARLASAYPATNKEFPNVAVATFNERFNGGPIRVVFLSMMGAVGFVLLIACANVANLLLSRSVRRVREIAVRVALGATRWRVVRQLLVESVLLGCVGGVLGLGLAVIGVRMFDAATQNVGKPYWIQFTMDYTVFGFLALVCVLTGILFGLAPALQVTRTNVSDVLKEGGRGNAGGRRARWMTGTMVVLELALTLVLLVGAGLMVRSFLKLYTLDVGIKTDHLLTMGIRLPDTKYPPPAPLTGAVAAAGVSPGAAGQPAPANARVTFYDQLLPRIRAVAGVESAALTSNVPPFGVGRRDIEIDGRPAPQGAQEPLHASVVTVSPGFFDAVGVQLRRGRDFREHDGEPGAETIVVNERFAAQFFAGEDPMGRRIKVLTQPPAPGQPAPAAPWRTIVGISPTIRHTQGQDVEPVAVIYQPYRQSSPGGMTLLVRSRLDTGAVMNAVRREVQAIDQDQPVLTAQTLDELMRQQTWPYRVFGTLFVLFAGIGLLLSAVGLYAVMAYSVTQRTPEIGVRMALGAQAGQVSWLILKRGLLQMALGLALGLAGAFGVSRVLQSLLVVPPRDPVTFVAITAILLCVAIAACVLPARRATRVDPLVALRAE